MKNLRRSLVVKAPGSSKKAKTIKSFPDLNPTEQFVPLPLSSVYGKSKEDVDIILRGWRLENERVELLNRERRRNPDLTRVKQLLDWFAEGYSIQADNFDQLLLIKDVLARHYQPGPEGTWKFSHPLSLPLNETLLMDISSTTEPPPALKTPWDDTIPSTPVESQRA